VVCSRQAPSILRFLAGYADYREAAGPGGDLGARRELVRAASGRLVSFVQIAKDFDRGAVAAGLEVPP
jgi:hypothetical protein